MPAPTLPAAGSQSITKVIREITWGTTPATTPTFLQLPVESNSLQLSKTTLVDNTLRSDRFGGDVRPGMKKVAGGIKFNYRRGDFDDILSNLLQAEWASNVLKPGKTPISHSIETGYTDISKFILFKGWVANTMALSVKPNGLISCSIDGIAKTPTAPTAVTAATTTTAPGAYEPFDSFNGSITEGGSSIATITGIDINYTNNLTESDVLFSDTIGAIISGNIGITGTLTAQFWDDTLYNKFFNNTASSISFTLADTLTKTHTWAFPKIMYTTGDINPSAPGELSLSMKFNVQYDSSSTNKCSLTRTV